MVDSVLHDESHAEIIAQAQSQVDILRGCGKQLIEELAAGGEPAILSQKVNALTSAAEAAVAAADGHVSALGPVLRAAEKHTAEAERAARAVLLQKRKDALNAPKVIIDPGPSLHFTGRSESEILELIVHKVATATGLPIELRGPSACRAPTTAAREVHVKVEGVLSALVALAAAGEPEAARVVLMSAEEAASGKDAWDTSAHQVFRRASDVAMQALVYFAERARADSQGGAPTLASSSALEDLLLYLSTYRELFTRPCSATGKLLALDPVSNQLLPPIVRPFMQSKHHLLAMAKGLEPCQAFHPHVEMP